MSENYIDKWNANGQMYDIQDAGRGLPNGVATLDLNGRVPYSQLPESAVEFKGYWNATTNTPTLADGTGTKGDMYYVDVAGIRDLGSGTQRFYVGDRVLYDGSVWKNMNPDLIDLFLPVGHLIWTSNANFDPNTQYPGTTWTQIKDKFILAAGDTYTNGATGGEASVVLTANQLPEHSHTFTGTSVITGEESQGHTHTADFNVPVKFGAAGIAVGGNGSFPPNSYDNAYLGNPKFSASGSFSVLFGVQQDYTTSVDKDLSVSSTTTSNSQHHTHTVTAEGTISTTGLNTPHNNMPPYVVKYCWERVS